MRIFCPAMLSLRLLLVPAGSRFRPRVRWNGYSVTDPRGRACRAHQEGTENITLVELGSWVQRILEPNSISGSAPLCFAIGHHRRRRRAGRTFLRHPSDRAGATEIV